MAVDGYEPPKDAWREQKRNLQKAVDLDSSLPKIHLEAGSRAFFFDWDWAAAERDFELATPSDHPDLVNPTFFVPMGSCAGRLGILKKPFGWRARLEKSMG